MSSFASIRQCRPLQSKGMWPARHVQLPRTDLQPVHVAEHKLATSRLLRRAHKSFREFQGTFPPYQDKVPFRLPGKV